MTTIRDFFVKYSSKIDPFDLEFIISHVLKKPRELVLARPEYKLTKCQISNVKCQILRRSRHEPLAYILGEKEFYALKFKVNKNVLIPRPETELLVEHAINNLKLVIGKNEKINIMDIGTGSGNIIISLACNLAYWQAGMKHTICNRIKYYATDISTKALAVARNNAKFHKIDKKIKFLKGNLLKPIIKKMSNVNCQMSIVIIANLPYLSPLIHKVSQISVKKYEPKMALLSHNKGLSHYERLFRQIELLVTGYGLRVTVFLEFSPEQKLALQKLINKYLPKAKNKFYKDLSGKWRVCCIKIKK